MRKEEKNKIIENLAEEIKNYSHLYLADTSELNAENTSKLRRMCFDKGVKLIVAKNTLLKLALEKAGVNDDGQLATTLKGATSIMLCNSSSVPGKLIKEFRKANDKPKLKGAYVEECVYIGGEQDLDALANMKSREELIGDIVLMLQTPAMNVISALQSGGNKLAGIVKTLSEKEN